MIWLFVNLPIAAVFFLAYSLIPLWLVIKHPDTGPSTPARTEPAAHSEDPQRLHPVPGRLGGPHPAVRR